MEAGFLQCGIRDWVAMAMISGAGLVAMLVLLAALGLLGLHIARTLRGFWPDVM